ncbi:MAG: 4-diphosphocytidyl-2C-methyl-D-erythritol kinase [Proteobacteria bacterium]|nr:4-diphosphocytidyl-2C-methyl-D-erythritol kinase [Pseudomonadota bacterium]
MTTQGGQANKTGNVLEQLVIGTLSAHGFPAVKHSDYKKNPNDYDNELLLRNVPYTTLYGGRGFTEFLLKSHKYDLEIRIECKWQQKPGSVDEKLPHVYLSAVNAIPEDNIIILIDGKGFREGAIQWLKNITKNREYIPKDNSNKNISIMNSTEFLTWCNDTFK